MYKNNKGKFTGGAGYSLKEEGVVRRVALRGARLLRQRIEHVAGQLADLAVDQCVVEHLHFGIDHTLPILQTCFPHVSVITSCET